MAAHESPRETSTSARLLAAKRTHKTPSRFAIRAREHFEDFARSFDVVRGKPMDQRLQLVARLIDGEKMAPLCADESIAAAA
jgi:hypothetical protein